jgi:hypothetical protein
MSAAAVVLLVLVGSAAAATGSKAAPPAMTAMNSLPSRAAVQKEMERICNTNETTYTFKEGEHES